MEKHCLDSRLRYIYLKKRKCIKLQYAWSRTIFFFFCKFFFSFANWKFVRFWLNSQLIWACSKLFFSHMRPFTSLQLFTLFSDKLTFLQNVFFGGSTEKGWWKLCRLYANKYLPWANTIKQRFTFCILFSVNTWSKNKMNNSACLFFGFFFCYKLLLPDCICIISSVSTSNRKSHLPATYLCVSMTNV